MTEQGNREWPSFDDILDELKTLGHLTDAAPAEPAAPVTVDEPTLAPIIDEPTTEFADASELVSEDVADAAEEAVVHELAAHDQSVPQHPFQETEETEVVDVVATEASIFDSPMFEAVPEPIEEPLPDPVSFDAADWSNGEATSNGFDSVATADAIESDLHDLFSLDAAQSDGFESFEPGEPTSLGDDVAHDERAADEAEDDDAVAEVVQLRPANDETHEAIFGLDAVFDPTAEAGDDDSQDWVSVEEAIPSTTEDPWAYMRPDDSQDVKTGFWANRPKFWGGEERKARKAERRKAAAAAEIRSNEPAPDCPNCGEKGQIDLDDPVGGKIHASCASCGHVWSQSTSVRESA